MLSSISVALNWNQFIDFTPYKQYVNDMDLMLMLKSAEDELNLDKIDEEALRKANVDNLTFRDTVALIRYAMRDEFD